MGRLKRLNNPEEFINELKIWEDNSENKFSWQEVGKIIAENTNEFYSNYDLCPKCQNERILIYGVKQSHEETQKTEQLIICRNCRSQEISNNIRILKLSIRDKNSPETLKRIEDIKDELEKKINAQVENMKKEIENRGFKYKRLPPETYDVIKKRILKEDYGIEWLIFIECNPNIKF